MKKSSKPRSHKSGTSKATIAAAVLSVPMLSAISPALARPLVSPAPATRGPSLWQGQRLKFADVYIKLHETFTIVGLDDGHTIYRIPNGGYFYLDPATGDMKAVSREAYHKFHTQVGPTGQALKLYKLDSFKEGGPVKLLGIDAQGQVVQQNSRGEKFYLNPENGDMVRVK